eukprot:CAMPEP_0206147010 /NCGR_PEP_ID=MMETSP1473-20131121/32143_1 /ASSEMBLY_ACC=CAM_ASM_001109 /TAXON_ID=1461547 /ORGANISM="Stichococcus sp, Strain RCC1054" /LENGTH=74 /DNA_ID=CAMNT_0053543777 /DNA_START=31 /DNA_END=255 /DNA_ORIENTATION=-
MAKAMAPRIPLNQIMNCCVCGMRRSGCRSEFTTAAAGQMLMARDTASATTATTRVVHVMPCFHAVTLMVMDVPM